MKARPLSLGFLAVLACTRPIEDAGIVLNVDTDVTADRSVINHITVTVDTRQQNWSLTRPLPGSLGIVTSPGNKSVLVEGFANSVLRGRWSGSILASKGKVIVQDVHLAYVGSGLLDGGAMTIDGGGLDVPGADGRSDAPADRIGLDVSGTGGTGGAVDATVDVIGKDLRGTGGISGTDGNPAIDGAVDLGKPDAVGTGGASGSDSGDAPGAPDGPNSDSAIPITAPLTGAFAVNSQFQVHATAAAPGPLADALGLVHGFVDDPANAILTFAADAGIPELSALQSELPSALYGSLTGWMNSYIKSANASGVVPYDQLVWLDDTVRSLLLYWGLQSSLALPVGQPGTHTPLAFIFTSPTEPLTFPIDASGAVPGAGITALASWLDGPSSAAVVTISDHAMAMPFGPYALPALNAILLAQYAAPDLGSFLSNAIGCEDMATSVASHCVGIVCVGHAGDLFAVCEGGLAEGARQIDDQIDGLRIQTLHFENGSATAVGASVSRPQDATSLESGVWEATVDFGNDPEPADATFSATAGADTPRL